MANNYLALLNVVYNPESGQTPETTKVTSISIIAASVDNQGNSTGIVGLLDQDFEMNVNGTPINYINHFDVTPIPGSAGSYSITFADGYNVYANSYMVLSCNKAGYNFNRLFIDFATEFNSTGTTNVTGVKITEPGKYKFVLNNVNGQQVNVDSPVYSFVMGIDKTKCSINASNLQETVNNVIPLNGLEVPLAVRVVDVNGNVPTGNNLLGILTEPVI